MKAFILKDGRILTAKTEYMDTSLGRLSVVTHRVDGRAYMRGEFLHLLEESDRKELCEMMKQTAEYNTDIINKLEL